ncbi:MAG: GxxExxY protein [Alteraurantiacibacter sp.]
MQADSPRTRSRPAGVGLRDDSCRCVAPAGVGRGAANLHAKQLLTYLRLSDSPPGLRLNFSGETMKEGIRRVAN